MNYDFKAAEKKWQVFPKAFDKRVFHKKREKEKDQIFSDPFRFLPSESQKDEKFSKEDPRLFRLLFSFTIRQDPNGTRPRGLFHSFHIPYYYYY